MNIKDVMLKYETTYSKYATKNKDAVRLNDYQEDIRPNFFRDIDRIIHSAAYTRYIDKTQVFSLTENDNVSRRMIHVQLVSKVARTISRALSLNEDLAEAIALGHDLGHVPFGHEGEKILDKISMENGCMHFMHNVQSARNLMYVSNHGYGHNLTVQVLDGILCHNGELELEMYKPKQKTKEEFFKDYLACYEDLKNCEALIPMTLEGCVVRISDIIAYLGRDIEDAVKLNIITKEQIPESIKNVLGDSNKTIINTIILDIINNSYGKNYLKLSKEVFNAIKDLKKFNNENIYSKAHTKEDLKHYEEMFRTLFNHTLNDLKENNEDNNIFKTFLKFMNEDYLKDNSKERIVIDYIAGMTDDFFISEYKKYK